MWYKLQFKPKILTQKKTPSQRALESRRAKPAIYIY